MANERPWIEMAKFSGLNNVDDPTRLIAGEDRIWPLVTAENIDIDNTGRPKQRLGYTSKVSLTRSHSLWADDDLCFFAYQDKLYKLNIDYSYTLVRSGLLVGAHLSYVRANDRIYYSNGSQIGYIDSTYTNHSITDPSITFKYPLPAGKFLEFYRARLYSGLNTILTFSDVLADYYDNRTNIIQFPTNIKMVLAVDNGLYVSDSFLTYFLPGDSPTGMLLVEVYPYPAIPYTGLKIDGHYIGNGSNGQYATWASTKGICIGDPSGRVVNVTDKRYSMGVYNEGAAMFDNTYGLFKYVTTLTN